jgi:hypothetical protein
VEQNNLENLTYDSEEMDTLLRKVNLVVMQKAQRVSKNSVEDTCLQSLPCGVHHYDPKELDAP